MFAKENKDAHIQAIEQAYQLFYKTLLGIAIKQYGLDPVSAEDFVHSAFERALKYGKAFSTYSDSQSFRFLYKILKNEIYTFFEKSSHIDVYIDPLEPHYEQFITCQSNPENLYLKTHLLKELINQLPEKYSSILYLHYYYGYSFKEISQFLNISKNTALQRNYYIKKYLRELLSQEDYPEIGDSY